MAALPLFDAVLSAGVSVERPARVAAQVIEAALSDLQQIEKLDASVAPDDPSQFDLRTASALRQMYEQWARDAQLLLKRVEHLQLQSGRVALADALRRAHGRTRARLSVSLEDMEESLRDLREGRTVPIEEVRRELRLRVH
jgi:hypothetical protein